MPKEINAEEVAMDKVSYRDARKVYAQSTFAFENGTETGIAFGSTAPFLTEEGKGIFLTDVVVFISNDHLPEITKTLNEQLAKLGQSEFDEESDQD